MIFVGYQPGSKGYQFWDAPTLWNFLWCEIQRILNPCKRKITDTARTSTIEWPLISFRVKHWFRLQFRPSHPKSTPTRPTQPSAQQALLQQALLPQPHVAPLHRTMATSTRYGNYSHTLIFIMSMTWMSTCCKVLQNNRNWTVKIHYDPYVPRSPKLLLRSHEFCRSWDYTEGW